MLVAAADIGQGGKLTAENVRWQRWPDDAMNGNYIQKQTRPDAIEQLQNSVVRSQFVAGEPIREVKLARPESGFLSAILPSGMRAIAVRISAQNTAGGFILPGDRVDVVQTVAQQTSPDAPAENVSRTILTNVKVLAIDQTVDEEEGEANRGRQDRHARARAAAGRADHRRRGLRHALARAAQHRRHRRGGELAASRAERDGADLPRRPQPNRDDPVKSPRCLGAIK